MSAGRYCTWPANCSKAAMVITVITADNTAKQGPFSPALSNIKLMHSEDSGLHPSAWVFRQSLDIQSWCYRLPGWPPMTILVGLLRTTASIIHSTQDRTILCIGHPLCAIPRRYPQGWMTPQLTVLFLDDCDCLWSSWCPRAMSTLWSSHLTPSKPHSFPNEGKTNSLLLQFRHRGSSCIHSLL